MLRLHGEMWKRLKGSKRNLGNCPILTAGFLKASRVAGFCSDQHINTCAANAANQIMQKAPCDARLSESSSREFRCYQSERIIFKF